MAGRRFRAWGCEGREISEKAEGGDARQYATLEAVAEEELETGEAGIVEKVPDVLGEIGEDGGTGKMEAGGPLVGEGVYVGEAGVAGTLEVVDELSGTDGRGLESFGAHGPESGDPHGSRKVVPFVGEIEVEEALAGAALAGFTVFEGEERGIADEQRGVGHAKHGFEVGRVGQKGGLNLPESREKDAGVDGGGAGSSVKGNAADTFHAVGMADDEDDGANAIARGDGAAGNNGEGGSGGKSGDGNQADIGFAGGEFGGAFRRHVVADGVAFEEAGTVGVVLEAPHERGWVEEADCGNAQTVRGHRSV